jgi:hypothetical protein
LVENGVLSGLPGRIEHKVSPIFPGQLSRTVYKTPDVRLDAQIKGLAFSFLFFGYCHDRHSYEKDSTA